MSGADDRPARGLRVPLRALWGKVTGGRLRQPAAREEKKRERRTEGEREEARREARQEGREEERKEAREEDKKKEDISI